MYQHLDDYERLYKANEIFSCFLQCMEFHPIIKEHSPPQDHVSKWHHKPKQVEQMNAVDMKNAEDLVLIAVELIYETELLDWTVLNPINFTMLSMLRHAEAYYEGSERLSIWLIKLYSKLGMMSLVQQYQQNLMYKARQDDLNYQRLGAAKLSTYTDFGMYGYLEEILSEYKDFYPNKVIYNKNDIVTAFRQRDFETIWPKMQENEKISKVGF